MTEKDPAVLAAELFNSPLRGKLEEFDLQVRKKRTVGLVLLAAGAVILLVGLKTLPAILIAGVVIAVVGVCVCISVAKGKRDFYRFTVVPQLVKAIDPELSYKPGAGLPRGKFDQLDLCGSYDRYSSEDRLTGRIGKTAIDASEVHIEKRHRDKDGKVTYTTVFRGVVFLADFNKHIKCRTAVMPDVAERCFGKLIGNFLQKFNFTEGKLVKLENPEFEKYYAVYSDDQIEARYILTPEIMEQLVKLRHAENNAVRVVFEDDHVAVALERNRGWLEPPSGKLASTAVLADGIDEIFTVLKVVELLDLNTRIWTKK